MLQSGPAVVHWNERQTKRGLRYRAGLLWCIGMNVDVDVQSFFAISLAVHIFYFQTKVVHGEILFFFSSRWLVCKCDAQNVDAGLTDNKLSRSAHKVGDTVQGQ